MYLKVLIKSFRMRKTRYIMPTLALIIGIAMLSSLIMVSESIEENLERELDVLGPNLIAIPKTDEIQLTVGDVDVGQVAKTEYIPENSAIDVSLLEKEVFGYNSEGELRVCSDPNVNALIYEVVTVDNDRQAVLAGVWFEPMEIINVWWSIEGDYPTDDTGVAVGIRIAEKWGLTVGQTLDLSYVDRFPTDPSNVFNASKSVTITGIVSTGGEDDSRIFGQLDWVQTLTDKEDKVNILHISTLCKTCDLHSIQMKIEELIPTIEVVIVKKVVNAQMTTLNLVNNLVGFISVVSIGGSILAVTTTMTLSVVERKKEIGLLRALGDDGTRFIALLAGEGAMIALVGGILGFFVGIIIAQLIGDYAFSSEIEVIWWALPVGLGAAVGTVLVATILPIRKAMMTDPVNVLRGD